MERALAPGVVVGDRYRVDALLGEGGMGAVYRASHVHMRKWVALKVLLPEWTSAPEVVARFEREAVAAGTIAHPNVAAATDFGRLSDGSFFLVLEYVEGRTLRAEVAHGPMDAARALHILAGVARGVQAAHAVGIVHRDLKPENVMLVDRDGDRDFVKVLDFGIAKLSDVGHGGDALVTTAGAILGTPDYMAPEQALGGTVDARADLYAIGVMLYEMLAGETPFKGGTVTLLRQHIMDAVPELPAPVLGRLPPSVLRLVTTLMQKEPSARLASAGDLLTAIDECLRELHGAVPIASPSIAATVPDSMSAIASASGPVPRATTKPGISPSHLRIALGAAAALLVAVGAALVSSARSASAPEAPAGYVALPPPPAPNAKPAVSPAAAPSAAPSATVSSAGASKLPPPSPSASSAKHGRKTGPGGIYIPPPSTWFH